MRATAIACARRSHRPVRSSQQALAPRHGPQDRRCGPWQPAWVPTARQGRQRGWKDRRRASHLPSRPLLLSILSPPPSYTARWKQPWRPAESPIASYGQRHGGRLTVAVGYEPAMAGGHIRLATLPSPEAALNEACPGSGPFAVSALAEIRVASLATASGMAHNRPKARVSKIATGLYRNIRMTLTQRERSRSDCPPGGTVVSCGRQRRSLRTAYQ